MDAYRAVDDSLGQAVGLGNFPIGWWLRRHSNQSDTEFHRVHTRSFAEKIFIAVSVR
jgi:hypothetical protein